MNVSVFSLIIKRCCLCRITQYYLKNMFSKSERHSCLRTQD